MLFNTFKATAQLQMPDNILVGAEKQYWVDSVVGSGSTYTWKIDDVVQQNGKVNLFSFTWNKVGNFFLEVQETSGNNCPGQIMSGWVNVTMSSALAIISPALEVPCAIEAVPPYPDLESFLKAGGNIFDNCKIDSATFRLSSEEITGIGYPEPYLIKREYTISDECGNTGKCLQTITVPGVLTAVATTTNNECQNNSTGKIDIALTGGTPKFTFLWNNGETGKNLVGLPTGLYTVNIIDKNGCITKLSVSIVDEGLIPFAEFTPGLPELMTYSFINSSTNAASYFWDFGDGQTSTSVNPLNTYSVTGSYIVTLIVSNNCGNDTATQLISLDIPELEFYNGFSPNGDGLNDSWNIPVLNYYPINRVTIINRWGSEVWKSINYNNQSNFWSGKNMFGKDLPDGTYFYIINYSNIEKRGWIFIKR
jgi:gliding motility-associated-like protein